jgi:hypothetical protein
MSFELEGKLIEKFDTVQVSDKFQKREFVLETEENAGGIVYTQNIKFQLMQAKCSEIDASNVGDVVKVHFNLQGRKWEKEGKISFFNTLNAWRIEAVGSGSIATPPQSQPTQMSEAPTETGDALPF